MSIGINLYFFAYLFLNKVSQKEYKLRISDVILLKDQCLDAVSESKRDIRYLNCNKDSLQFSIYSDFDSGEGELIEGGTEYVFIAELQNDKEAAGKYYSITFDEKIREDGRFSVLLNIKDDYITIEFKEMDFTQLQVPIENIKSKSVLFEELSYQKKSE